MHHQTKGTAGSAAVPLNAVGVRGSNPPQLLASAASSRRGEVLPSLALILRMRSEQLATDAAVEARGIMAGQPDNPAGQRKSNMFS